MPANGQHACRLQSFVDPLKGEALSLRTSLGVDTRTVFSSYRHDSDLATDVTFNLKDFRALLSLCEHMAANVALTFDQPGMPLVAEPLAAANFEHYSAELVLATLMESQLQQQAAWDQQQQQQQHQEQQGQQPQEQANVVVVDEGDYVDEDGHQRSWPADGEAAAAPGLRSRGTAPDPGDHPAMMVATSAHAPSPHWNEGRGRDATAEPFQLGSEEEEEEELPSTPDELRRQAAQPGIID